jgi:hypothetical protein
MRLLGFLRSMFHDDHFLNYFTECFFRSLPELCWISLHSAVGKSSGNGSLSRAKNILGFGHPCTEARAVRELTAARFDWEPVCGNILSSVKVFYHHHNSKAFWKRNKGLYFVGLLWIGVTRKIMRSGGSGNEQGRSGEGNNGGKRRPR